VVFTTPLVRGLRRAFPDAQLTYVVEPAAAPVVRGNPHLDEVIVVPRRRGLARVRDDVALARQLRRRRFDVAIDLHGGPRSGWLTWMSGAPIRIGYAVRGRTWMYTHRVRRAPEPSVRHSVLNQWDLLSPLGIAGPPDPSDVPVEMPSNPDSIARVAEIGRLPAGSDLIVVHVSASNPFKRWPASSFVQVIVQLVEHDARRHVAVVSGPSEPAAAEDVAAAAQERLGALGAHVFAPRLDLPELHALITRASLYLGGDSGPLHVAATTRAPIVELLGPTVASRSFPWRSPERVSELLDAGPLPCRPCTERHCVPGDFRCLTGITPDRVIDAAERALAAAHGTV
jgi:ADP-heptose:LPS heptosyltransferase